MSLLKTANVVIAVTIIIVVAIGVLAYFLIAASGISYVSTPEVSKYTTEYPTSSSLTEPAGIVVDAKGDVWFTLQNQSRLAELTPATGRIQEFAIPTHEAGGTVTWGMALDNSRGLVWFTEQVTNSIWSFNIVTHKFHQYKIKTPHAFPFGITVDEQGNVWFAEFFGNNIGEILTNGTLHEIPIPQRGDLEASGIAVSPAGTVWFTLPGVDEIGSYFHGKFTFQNLTGVVSLPVGIAVTSNGSIFFTQHGPSFISEFNPTNGYLETISTTVPSYYYSSLPYFIYPDQYGSVWFNEHEGNAMAEFFPSNNTLIEYYIPTRVVSNISGMLTSTVSPAGNPWYTELFAGKVGTINTTAAVDIHLTLPNYTRPLVVSPQRSASIKFSLTGSDAGIASIKENVGNFTSKLSFAISGDVGVQVLTIFDNGSTPGTYFVTVSAVTDQVAVSQIVELEVE
jgi:virginiamycin B lyase